MSETISDEDDPAGLPVADRVLKRYLRVLSNDQAMVEVAGRMKVVLLDGKTITEQSLRQALFGEQAE